MKKILHIIKDTIVAKKYANKVVRRYKGEIYKGDGYKKCFDYWWTVD